MAVLLFFPDIVVFVTSLLQVNVCGYKEEIAFSENLLALNTNGQCAGGDEKLQGRLRA